MLLCEPLLEVVLLVVTALDLKNGAEPDWKHGLAALYIGYTVATATARSSGSTATPPTASAARPPPAEPPRYGTARAQHEGKLWLRTRGWRPPSPSALLQLAIWYVGDAGDTGSLEAWQFAALRAVGIHGLIALSVHDLAEEGPGGRGAPSDRRSRDRVATAEDAELPGSEAPAGACRRVSARRPAPTARPRPPCWPSGPG